MRRVTRDLLWLAVLMALGAAWLYCLWRLGIEIPTVKHDTPPPDEAIFEYRQLLNNLN
jgi:hypothetical protein